jgi:hypothetical protein
MDNGIAFIVIVFHSQSLTFSVAASVLILRAELAPKEADGAKAAAGAAKKRVAIASFILIIIF